MLLVCSIFQPCVTVPFTVFSVFTLILQLLLVLIRLVKLPFILFYFLLIVVFLSIKHICYKCTEIIVDHTSNAEHSLFYYCLLRNKNKGGWNTNNKRRMTWKKTQIFEEWIFWLFVCPDFLSSWFKNKVELWAESKKCNVC